jgi:hypothetical protein
LNGHIWNVRTGISNGKPDDTQTVWKRAWVVTLANQPSEVPHEILVSHTDDSAENPGLTSGLPVIPVEWQNPADRFASGRHRGHQLREPNNIQRL